jgi:hypothetical protein
MKMHREVRTRALEHVHRFLENLGCTLPHKMLCARYLVQHILRPEVMKITVLLAMTDGLMLSLRIVQA